MTDVTIIMPDTDLLELVESMLGFQSDRCMEILRRHVSPHLLGSALHRTDRWQLDAEQLPGFEAGNQMGNESGHATAFEEGEQDGCETGRYQRTEQFRGELVPGILSAQAFDQIVQAMDQPKAEAA